MKRVYLLPALAILGLCIAIAAVFYDNRPATVQSPPILTPLVPYSSYISGAGIIEASTGNIAIGTPVSGVVVAIYVKVGEHVSPGDPLFKIDDRDLQGQLLTSLSKVQEAEAALKKPQHQLDYAESLRREDRNAISAQNLSMLRDEVALVNAALDLAKAQVTQIRLEIERRTVHAAMAAEVLQLKMRLGQYVEGTSLSAPLLILGGDDRLNLRVDIDEYDAWRFQQQAQVLAFIRGHPLQKIALHYEYTEPYIVPKTTLTGQATERSDTRVLQVIYSFARSDLPVYIGQQLDVFIQAPPITANK